MLGCSGSPFNCCNAIVIFFGKCHVENSLCKLDPSECRGNRHSELRCLEKYVANPSHENRVFGESGVQQNARFRFRNSISKSNFMFLYAAEMAWPKWTAFQSLKCMGLNDEYQVCISLSALVKYVGSIDFTAETPNEFCALGQPRTTPWINSGGVSYLWLFVDLVACSFIGETAAMIGNAGSFRGVEKFWNFFGSFEIFKQVRNHTDGTECHVAFSGCDLFTSRGWDAACQVLSMEKGQRDGQLMPLLICRAEKGSMTDVVSLGQRFSSDGGNIGSLEKFNCMTCPQAAPVVANKVEGVRHPFFISLADLGTPEKPNRNFLRMLKGKLFRKPDISQTIQEVLEKLESNGLTSQRGLVVDVGANVGMATFAAAAMGYKVVAFEAVFENLQRLCDGMYLNRARDTVSFYNAAVSDILGNLTMHKV
eukprot:Gb_00167 [translate_table: standard]